MDKTGKFLLPSPKFLNLEKTPSATPHFLSPQGMLLPKDQQPPPMYGPRGSTVPPKFLGHQRNPTSTISNHQSDRTQKFYCDPCEAEFHTSTDFKVHRSEHVQCEIDNCSFWGHPSFMDTHIGLQHATGLYTELKKLSTPEEIAEWRAQRKKNYPTVAAVLQKQKAREQRIMRGEKLEAKRNRFGNREDRRQMTTEPRGDASQAGGRKNSKRQNRKRNRFGKPMTEKEVKKEEVSVKKEEDVDEPAVCGGLKMFTGTGGMSDYKKVKKVESHALTGLLGMYGSDSDDEEDSNGDDSENFDQPKSEILIKDETMEPTSKARSESTPSSQTTTKEEEDKREEQSASQGCSSATAVQDASNSSSAQLKSNQPCNDDQAPTEVPIIKSSSIPDETESSVNCTVDSKAQHSSDDEGPEEVPIAKSSPAEPQCNPENKGVEIPQEAPIAKKPNAPAPAKKDKKLPPKKKPRHYGLDYRKLRAGRQNTLLEKLLETDIRHERNVLLQCVRFVVQNNFFGIGSSTTQPDA